MLVCEHHDVRAEHAVQAPPALRLHEEALLEQPARAHVPGGRGEVEAAVRVVVSKSAHREAAEHRED